MIILSTWIKERCRKVLYYQKTRVIIWNLLRITNANALMWCDIFHFFVGRNKKRTGNGRKLPVKHNDWRPYYRPLFFYLLLVHYVKIFFVLLVVGQKKSLPFHGRDVDFADGIVLLDS